jgi:hypothetical protein
MLFHSVTNQVPEYRTAEIDTNGTTFIQANQNTTNINGKKYIWPTEKLIICEIVFCGLATRSVDIVTDVSITDNSIRYRAVIDRI